VIRPRYRTAHEHDHRDPLQTQGRTFLLLAG
jgi:hypothetical protein